MENIEKEALKKRIRIGIRIFLLITVLTLFFILFKTGRRETLEALRRFSPLYGILTMLLWAVSLGFDSLQLKIFGMGVEKNIGIINGVNIITMGQFLAATTPFQVSGIFVQVYYLKKHCNVETGQGTSIIFLRAMTGTLVYLLSSPFILIFARDAFRSGIVKNILIYIGIIIGIGGVVLALALINPKKFSRLFARGKKGTGFFNQVVKFRDTLGSILGKKYRLFIIAFFSAFISFIAYFLMAFTILKGLGVEVPIVKVILFQLILRFGLFFSPSPGGSGFAEAGFAGLFYNLIPKYLLGIYTSLWRLFTTYIGATLGGILTLKFLKEI